MRRVSLAILILLMFLGSSAFATYFNILMDRAEHGDINAQFNLGRIYMFGDDVKHDYKKAFEWYLKAAENSHVEAQYWLGYMYYMGYGVKSDDKKASEWLLKAAENGRIEAKGLLTSWATGGSKEANEALAKLEALEKQKAPAQQEAPIQQQVAVKQDTPVKQNTTMQQNTPPKQNVTAQRKPPVQQKASSSSTSTKITEKPAIIAQSNTTTTRANNNARSKPRMAVRSFVDRTGESQAAAGAIMDMMVSELSKAKVFSLMERERFDEYLGKEITLGQSGLIDPSTAPAVGKLKGLQYTMTGAITLFYYSEKASGVAIPVLGMATQAKTAYVVLDIRILDNVTGEIVYASDQTGQAKQVAKGAAVTDKRFFIGSYSKQTGGLLQEAARDAVRKHVSAIRNLSLQS